ncbi:hypothetical protein [Nitratireductor sp. ZSWI3]|uniref:hypothetical protein n=1 Tax=Nitratireductor sp. ZSWI3 TaxID=2966359 RepID=UPI00214FE8C9|nr:hypothetical protein [Nitratireductor sp. ZSWI3]MCR4265852.1 hypothetical protein [Nitratireductor sp. ZSWI3]
MRVFSFDKPPVGDDDSELIAKCERQLRPIVLEIVRSALATGWSREDILLSLVEVSWDLYEQGRDSADTDYEAQS